MLKEKEESELDNLDYVFRANNIPKTTKEPLYQKIMQ